MLMSTEEREKKYPELQDMRRSRNELSGSLLKSVEAVVQK